MKKITILLLAFMVPMLMQAQAKRRPAGAKAATTAKKPAQKATQKVNNNFAIVQFDEWMKHDVFEDENNIYFLGTTYGENTFRAIDKKTGDIRIVVPKKKRARPQICSAGSNGKDVFMRIENKGIIRFNGTDVNTSEMILPQSEQYKGHLIFGNRGDRIIGSPDGKQIALVGDDVVAYDLEKKMVVRHCGAGILKTDASVLFLDNGTIVKGCPFALMFIKPQLIPAPNIESMNKTNLQNVDEYNIKKIGNGGGGEATDVIYYRADTMLYAGFGEQVLKTRTDKIAWQEAYTLPGENKKFVHIAAMGKNHVIGQTDNYEKKFYVWDNKDFTGQPTILKNIDTGIGQPDKWSGIVETKKIEGFTKVFTDSASNLWIQTGDGEFVIYNPDGIVGLTALKGKLTKNELPKEED